MFPSVPPAEANGKPEVEQRAQAAGVVAKDVSSNVGCSKVGTDDAWVMRTPCMHEGGAFADVRCHTASRLATAPAGAISRDEFPGKQFGVSQGERTCQCSDWSRLLCGRSRADRCVDGAGTCGELRELMVRDFRLTWFRGRAIGSGMSEVASVSFPR